MSRTFLLPTALLLLTTALGCGAPASTQSTIPSEQTEATGAAAPVSTAAKDNTDKTEEPVDKQAEQAKAYCSHEVEQSVIQPPDQLTKKQINACLIGIRPTIQQECNKGVEKEIVLKIIVDKSGDVSGAFPVGDFADSPEATCIADAVKKTKFPQFKGKGQQVIEKYPFKIEQ